MAGIAILTSLSIPGLIKLFASFENDEVKAHLNALAADCLSVSANMVDSEELMPAPTSVDTNLLNKNGYVEKSGNSCMYFQINPKNSSSKTHFSMGFGIANNKVTKFAIKDSANSNDITTECKQWAGEANCLNSGNDYSDFFKHMDNVRTAQASCILKLEEDIENNGNPANGGTYKTWDVTATKDCKDKTLPLNSSASSYTSGCSSSQNNCSKEVKVKDSKIVGYSQSDYDQAQILECSNSISDYINSDSYNGGSETKTDLAGCTGEKYICNYNEHNIESFKVCEIEDAISKCKLSLNWIRTNAENSPIPYVVGAVGNQEDQSATQSLEGLPPCGQKVWVCDEVIHESKASYEESCPS